MLPLHIAAATGDDVKVLALLRAGSSPNAQTSCEEGWTPLVLASREGHETTVGILLENGAHPNPSKHKHYALRAAAIGGHKRICQMLVKAGADVNQTSFGNRTPLHGAILKRHVELACWLIESGAAVDIVNDFGETSYSLAKELKLESCLAKMRPLM